MLETLKEFGRIRNREVRLYQLLMRDPRTPVLAKTLFLLTIGYPLLRFDLVPDFIPSVGHLDEALIIPGLILCALKRIPKERTEQYRLNLATTSDGITTPELQGIGHSGKRPSWSAGHIALVLLIAIVPLGYGYWWVRTWEPVNVVLDQLRAIEAGQHWRAYQYLSLSARKKLSLSEFKNLLEDNSILEEPYSIRFPSRSIEGNTATISGVIEGYGEYSSDAKYVLIREDGQWRIESLEWGPVRPEVSGK